MKIKTDNFTRERFELPKQVWLSRLTFVSGNIALSNLSIKVIDAKVNNYESVNLQPSEATALVMHGIAYAKKDTPLGKLREMLSKASIEQGRAVVYGLPNNIADYIAERNPEIAEKFLKEFGMELNISTLMSEVIKDMYNYEIERKKAQREVNEDFKKLKDMFLNACREDVVNPRNNAVVKYYEDMINKTVKYLESEKKVEKNVAYEKAYTSVAYSIQRSAIIYGDLITNRKTIGDILIPDKRDSLALFKAESNAKEIFIKIKKAFDQNFHFGKLKEEIIEPLGKIYSQKDIESIKETLKEYVANVLSSIEKSREQSKDVENTKEQEHNKPKQEKQEEQPRKEGPTKEGPEEPNEPDIVNNYSDIEF